MFEQYIANDYLRAFAILVGLLFIFRLSLSLITRIIIKLTSKTKSDLDDKLVQNSSKPLTLLALLASLKFAITELNLQESTLIIINNSIYSFGIIVVSYLVFVIINLIAINGLKHFAKKTHSRLDDTVISLLNSVINIALVIISLIYILDLWGVEIGPLLAGLGIAGIAVALALQPILSNIFSGAAVVLDQSIRVGDVVFLDDKTRGKIEKIGLRSTKMRTFDNELLIIPNTKLAESVIQNIALPEPKSRVVIPFAVAYGSDVEQVKKVVLSELKKIKNFSNEPEPMVRFIEMGGSSLNFKAYLYVDSFEHRFEAIDEANTRIYNILRKNKIEIPFPQMDVHLKK
jgi:small-conductance mechanosensitive channel